MKFRTGVVLQYGLMVFVVVVMSFPILWIISSSLKPMVEFSVFPPRILPSRLYWQNYSEVFANSKLLVYLRNTLILIAGNTGGTLLSSSIVAYPLARMRFRGRELIFALILMAMMVPSCVTIIPGTSSSSTWDGWIRFCRLLCRPFSLILTTSSSSGNFTGRFQKNSMRLQGLMVAVNGGFF